MNRHGPDPEVLIVLSGRQLDPQIITKQHYDRDVVKLQEQRRRANQGRLPRGSVL